METLELIIIRGIIFMYVMDISELKLFNEVNIFYRLEHTFF